MRFSNRDRMVDIVSYIFVAVFSVICLYPLLLTLMVSISDDFLVQVHGIKLIPMKLSLDTYRFVWIQSSHSILRAYGMTILVTSLGVLFSLTVTSMFAYTLSQKHIRYRYKLSFFAYFAECDREPHLVNGSIAEGYHTLGS